MAKTIKCPRCGQARSWKVRRGKRKCSRCRYEWRADRLPLHLSHSEWKRLLRWFLLGLSSTAISREAGLGREQVLRALTIVTIHTTFFLRNFVFFLDFCGCFL